MSQENMDISQEDMDMSQDDMGSISASFGNLGISARGPPDIEERLTTKIGEIDKEKQLVLNSKLLLARFSQFKTLGNINVHENLTENIFSDAAMTNILDLIKRPSCIFYVRNPHGITEPPLPHSKHDIVMKTTDINILKSVNIRFASFYVVITNNPEMPIQIYLIPTLPILDFYVIDITKLSNAEVDVSRYTICPDGVMCNLGLKIIRELQVLGFKLDGTDRPGKILFSFDVYYNRPRDHANPNNDSSGTWHRDISSGIGNDTNFVSLEYFVPREDIVMLGPEAFYNPIEGQPLQVYTSRYPDDVVKQIYEARQSIRDPTANSFRVLAKNGTTILFNNKELIHATPITRPIRVYPKRQIFGQDVTMNVFGTNTERLEVSRPDNFVVKNTAEGNRSFVRCWVASCDQYGNFIEHGILIKYDIDTIRKCIISMPPFQGSAIEPTDIFGGTVTINSENNIVPKMIEPHMVDTNSNVKTNLLLKSEMQSKNSIINEGANKLFEFKMTGNPLNSPITLDFDVPFEDIVGETNINNYKLKEMIFISSISNKKGGKNRRYKKRYNNKTKKAIKTKKVRKLKRTTKTKKVKRVKKLHKYSKKNYKY